MTGVNVALLFLVGTGLLGVVAGSAIVYITGPRWERRYARTVTLCHKKIAVSDTWSSAPHTVFCRLEYGHSGECCAPLSEFEKAGYQQPPF